MRYARLYYKALVAHFAPIVAQGINAGLDPLPIAQAVKNIIEDAASEIAVQVGQEAELFVPMRKSMDDQVLEEKVKETFGL